MSIKVALRHQMSYDYDRAVNLSPHIFRLRPAPHCRTPILSYSLKILPENKFINWQQDPFGNITARVVFPEKTKQLHFEVEVIAEIIVINPFDFFVESYAEKFPFAYTHHLKKELAPYFEITDNGPMIQEWVKKIDVKTETPINDFLVNLNQQLWKYVNYTVRFEPGVQTAEETLSMKSGSCRDSTWLLVQILRHLGLAARFVSGYLIQLKADQKALDGPSGTEKDFTDLHAWAEVYLPGAGWVGLDPTSGLYAGEGHIPLCCTPDPISAAPVTGMTDICETTFTYKNEITRIHEDPRVTKPYSDEQWATIVGLGNKIDEEIVASDMRLTMGGEPTFVSVDDMESKEWNTAADGPGKRVAAEELITRLKGQFGNGGLIHLGQGKWYPGEPLPRWQYSAIWRNDHQPIWQNTSLLDVAETKSSYVIDDVKKLSEELTHYLNLPTEHIHPAYEDAFYFLWEEGKVPVNADPYKANLEDPLERRKLAEILQSGIQTPAGFVVPMEWNHWSNRWISSRWEFRNKNLFLVPGNSPMGLRLPLKSLAEISTAKLQKAIERSPFEDLPKLDNYHEKVKARYSTSNLPGEIPKEFYAEPTPEEEEKPDKNKPAKKKVEKKEEEKPLFDVFVVKTALCLELRAGKIYIFMPPLKYLEHYLDLLASIEAAAEKLNLKVVIEGYEPPFDKRTTKLAVTPDPGVIEVNVHPAKTWNELLHNYDTLFEQARLSRLGSEKFMLDGKHTGTGGGNHITIGGITPSDSPILRRPDMLKSMITYWQQHPGLSYLFSTQFIGPTSQAPRVDEGRQEILYELEIAFRQIEDKKEMPFWVVDRIFRNLLIDITGNTHRAEFCIDKLYSPDSASGRLGILELRGFDMPPNKQMCIVQLLLIRSLLAWFWKTPYNGKLVRWGTELYDKYLLPHYVEQDMRNIVADLQQAGYPFQLDWLDPFFEFRFPLYGKIKVEDMEMILRMGIEPWHVLGEETSSMGTARFVDSSVERVEVKVKNFNYDRYIVTCNGKPVPLKQTAVRGEYVAGIRYRAWSPPSALHPMLGTDVPLVFDIVDTWNKRSLGGCTYFVAHPGGRSYDAYPVNSYEAEGRRISRFWNHGHTQGAFTPSEGYVAVGRYVQENLVPKSFDPPPLKISPEYPNTLDMRRD